MQTKETEDIVFIEAFKVVKDNFISKVNHEEDDVEKALGCDFEGKRIMEFEEFIQLASFNSFTKATVQILTNSPDLNEFAAKLRAFSLLSSEVRRKTKQLENEFLRNIEDLLSNEAKDE